MHKTAKLVGALSLLAVLAGAQAALAKTPTIPIAAPAAGAAASQPSSSLGDFGIPKMFEQLIKLIDIKHADNLGILFRERVAVIINFMFALSGLIAVLMGIISGYIYMTSYGNEEQAATAKKTIFYTAIGLAMVLSVWTILQLFTTFVGKAGTDSSGKPAPTHGLEGQL